MSRMIYNDNNLTKEVNMWTIEFYKKSNGEKPAKEFILNDLDKKMRATALALISRLKTEGNKLSMPYSKYIEDGILELRIKQSSNIARVFYFFVVGSKIVLTNGFVKKSQKTPPREIERAKEYKKDYERSNEKNGKQKN